MKLLKELYKIYSPSGNERKMQKFLMWWVKKNIPSAKVSKDKKGNIYVLKGKSDTYPCIVSHIDQVQKNHSKDFQVIDSCGALFGYSMKNKRLEGLGADDKNGIWVCLKCLEKYDAMKAAFFVEEETGCCGSSECDLGFFDDCRFVLQCDRRNGTDLITNILWTELCSGEFLNDTGYEDFGYKMAEGMLTDVCELKENGLKVSALNISCGYYSPHTDQEFTVKSELANCLNFVQHIIETCTNVYPHEDLGYGDFYLSGYHHGRHFNGSPEYDAYLGEEYDEAFEIIEDYLNYAPNTPAEEVYERYKDCFFYLTKDDIIQMTEDIKNMDFMN